MKRSKQQAKEAESKKNSQPGQNQYAFFFDSSACSACKSCVLACRDKNNWPAGVRWRRVYELSGGEWLRVGNNWVPDLIAYNLSLGCNHCEEPVCLKGCPSGAISKRPDGIVLIDRKKCLGCRYCEWSCPYGAPQYDVAAGRMTKCDLCVDLVDQGEKPACVSACPMRALDFGPLDELMEKYGQVRTIFPLPAEAMTRPAFIIKLHPTAAKARPGDVTVSNSEEV